LIYLLRNQFINVKRLLSSKAGWNEKTASGFDMRIKESVKDKRNIASGTGG
jgi:hypothetical protein